MKTFTLNTESELLAVAKEVKSIAQYRIFLLIGDLGAGKTTFTKRFLSTFDNVDEASSPTFSIINEYHGTKENFYHIDLYRLNTLDEAMDIGIEDYLYSGNYCLIEWPQLIQDILLNEHHVLEFHILEGDKRSISFK